MAKNEIYPYFPLGYDNGPKAPRIMVHEHERPTAEARFAMELLTRLSINQIDVDGEDSAGRQKARLLTAAECAERACEITQQAFDQFRERGWLEPVPSLAELSDIIKDRENAAEKPNG